jgi:hypothetical protein
MSNLIDLLKKSAETYTNLGEYFKLNANECVSIEEEVGEKIFESYPVEVTDSMYDYLYDLGKSLYPDDDFFKKVGSPVERTMGKFKLPFTMGSMTQVHNSDELMKWVKPNTEYCYSSKLDGCLQENTLIETTSGFKTIKEIYDSNDDVEIKSFNNDTNTIEFKKVTNKLKRPSTSETEWYKITCENGEELIVTSNHYIFIPSLNAYREVRNLKEGDYILYNK